MPFPAYTQLPSPPAPMSRAKLPRPRGLWRAARQSPKRLDAPKRPYPEDHYNPTPTARRRKAEDHSDGDCCDSDSSSNSSSKRIRLIDSPPTSDEDGQDEVIFWDYSRKCSSQPDRVDNWTTRSKVLNTSSSAAPGQMTQVPATFSLEDWQDLKELFSKAVDIYENKEPLQTIPFLRGVIHECHRFMRAYQDPSTLYAAPAQPGPEKSDTVPSERLPEWLTERPPLYPQSRPSFTKEKAQQQITVEPEKKCKCKDLPTAFHTILGTTLFLFGNLIAQDPSLALQGEPRTPTPYWLSAIDVFQMGENLPIRTSGRVCPSAPEDWRMAVVWGRTLVNLADEVLTRQTKDSTPVPTTPMSHSSTVPFTSVFLPSKNIADEPKWPADSPFALIAASRSPSSFRINLDIFTADELLKLAQDQFYRGIFHMPHQRGTKFQRVYGSQTTSKSSSTESFAAPPKTPLSLSLAGSTFCRATELYTIGSEVLLLAERLQTPSERCEWAKWADGIFNQMAMESNNDWKVPLTIARGRSNVIMGSAIAEELDNELERGEMQVLDSEEAEDARDALTQAVTFLEKARELISSDPAPGPSSSSAYYSAGDLSKTSMVEVFDESEAEEIRAAILDDPTSVIMSSEEETTEQAEIRTLLAEALLTLANLTANEVEREALYARAYKEGKGSFELDEDRMDESG